jgi:hypothetical protein
VYLNDKQRSNKKGLRQSNQLKGLIFVVKSRKGKCLRVCKYIHTIYVDRHVNTHTHIFWIVEKAQDSTISIKYSSFTSLDGGKAKG